MNTSKFQEKNLQLRHLILDMFQAGNRGHVPSAFSLVEILSTLYYHHANLSADKILLSKGHGCLALYAVLADLKYFPKEEINNFCKPEGILGGHPTRSKIPGVEISAGSLGHGPSIAVGMAFNTQGNVYCILGDGECNEGTIWEAALSANKNKLKNLTFIIDYNKQQSYGATEQVLPLEPFPEKWKSFGFEVLECDIINKSNELQNILRIAQTRPRVIICHTKKGFGSHILEQDLSWHHRNSVSEEEIEKLRQSLRTIK
ncbi:transketolase [Bacteriovorax sp. Seq25_V]|uniref:transketolase n=1 Tax=Bacteriovorax sp. Seq25_V TaxID=1201288 RepID=UPI00038A3D82|nr:transketolase, thiamine pyrophosphate-binding domain protein [Bacteriovorax sp. Seq25_V]